MVRFAEGRPGAGFSRIELDAWEFNGNALKFYESIGLQPYAGTWSGTWKTAIEQAFSQTAENCGRR